ncbi:MAG: cupin domain-containing protein [Actinomycetota bacterium]|nr:cupin domain-containing protein [Actinomycetota bacterium]
MTSADVKEAASAARQARVVFGSAEVAILKRARDTDGAYLLVEVRARPGFAAETVASHPCQSETFEVVAGELGAEVAGERVTARAGDLVVVEPATSYRWWNACGDELVVRWEVRPALQLEDVLRTAVAALR